MSKRMKLVTGPESEMEERSFLNPHPDWDQGTFTPGTAGSESDSEHFDSNGKVSVNEVFMLFQFIVTHCIQRKQWTMDIRRLVL